MLADLRDVPGIEVVRDPKLAFVLEAFASFEGWMRHSFGGLISLTSSSFARSLMAYSHMVLVGKVNTGALFLLIATGAWLKGCLDIRGLTG